MKETQSLETLYVHAGHRDQWPNQVPTAPALITSTSFRTETPEAMDAILGGEEEGFTYSRHANPTVAAFAEAIRVLEAGTVAQAYASGMAALDAALFAVNLKPGDHLLLSRDLYGATINLSEKIWGEMGIVVHTVDMTQLDEVETALGRWRPKALLLETLSNPIFESTRSSRAHHCRARISLPGHRG